MGSTDTSLIWRVENVGVVPSTMDIAGDAARAGAPAGLVIVADHQTAGRGRAGRPWVDTPGSSLLCSVLLRPNVAAEHLSAFSLLAAVAVADAIESVSGLQPTLKWPNDVLIDGRKAAGVLLTSRISEGRCDFLIVGIGINLQRPCDPGLDAASLADSTNRPVRREELLATLLLLLHVVTTRFVDPDAPPDLSGWTRRAAYLGDQVSVQSGQSVVTGRLLGVDHRGAVLLGQPGAEPIAVVAGDLVRGPKLLP